MQFSSPKRQSAKGIIVILGISLFKVAKQVVVVFSLVLLKYLTSDKSFSSIHPAFYLSFVGVIVFLAIVAYLKYRTFYFYLTDSHFIVKKGIINKEETSIPKHKIQNVYVKQNFVQQLINVVSVAVETAGDDSTEIEIKALSKNEAEVLRQLLLTNRSLGAETHTAIEHQPKTDVYAKAGIAKLMLEGISENHFRSFVLILFFIVGLYNDFKELLRSIKIKTQFDEYLELNETEVLSIILFNVVLVVVIFVFAFLLSIVKTLIENFGLIVFQNAEGLEISKGLFNKVKLGLKPSRIQTTQLKTNRFKRLIGLYHVSFTQAMLNKKQKKNFTIIGLDKSKADNLIKRFYPQLDNEAEQLKPSRYFILRHLMFQFLFIGICNLIFSVIALQLFWLNIPLLFFTFLSVKYTYAKAYYTIDENYLVVGSGGIIDTKTDHLELHKVQAIELSQTIFQKRRGVASIKVFSASRALAIPHISLELAQKINNYLLYNVESTHKSWM